MTMQKQQLWEPKLIQILIINWTVDFIPNSWTNQLLPGLGQITGSWFPHPHSEDSFNKCLSVSTLSDSESTAVGEKRQLKLTVYHVIQVNNIYSINCYREEIKWGDVNKCPAHRGAGVLPSWWLQTDVAQLAASAWILLQFLNPFFLSPRPSGG